MLASPPLMIDTVSTYVGLTSTDDGGAGCVGAGLDLFSLVDGGNVALNKSGNVVFVNNVPRRD